MSTIVIIKNPVKKIIQSPSYICYEGYDEEQNIFRYISVQHNKQGDNGKTYQFTLYNGKVELVEGPWLDFTRNWL